MKIIGRVQPVITDDMTLEDPQYSRGSIVVLSEEEFKTLVLLQDALAGGVFRWEPSPNSKLDNTDMSNAFNAIRSFVEAKFSINEFKITITRLEALLEENV